MKPTQATISAATKLSESHPCVKELLEFYEFVIKSPVYESYVARMITLNQWNEDLIGTPVSIISTNQTVVTDDGIDEKEIVKKDKEVDRVLKFLEKQPDLLKGTDQIRLMLTPDQASAILSDSRILKSRDLPL